MIPEPVPASVSLFLALHIPDTSISTYAVVSLESAPTPVPAQSVEKLPLYFVKPKSNMCKKYFPIFFLFLAVLVT